MDDQVLSIIRNNFDLSNDIAELEQFMGECVAFTEEKLHLQNLLAQICANEEASDTDRQNAARVLIKHSDLRAAIESIPNYEMLIDEVIQAVKHGGVRH